MKMLEVYIEHEPKDIGRFQKADWMARFVCSLIELKDYVKSIQDSEYPCKWVNIPEGWELPENPKL